MNRYMKLFTAYIDEMRKSKALADSWWEALVAEETRRLGDPVRAQAEVDERWPFGNAAHPFVLATYRKYFLECEALNDLVEAAEAPDEEDDDEDDWGEEDAYDGEEAQGVDLEGPEQSISPHALLIDLLPARHPDLEEFLSGMVFAPIGLDDADRSV